MLSVVNVDTDVDAHARMLTLSHADILSSHNSAKTHMPLHPLHLGALSNNVRNTHGTTQPGKMNFWGVAAVSVWSEGTAPADAGNVEGERG